MAMYLPYYTASQKIRDNVPYDYYKGLEQAIINAQWSNTTSLYTVQEQDAINTWTFTDLEVRLNHILGESTVSRKQGNDFRTINFQDLDHEIILGLYYKFANSYWLTTFLDEVHLLTKNIVVRRCNNWLKWKNITTNTVYEYPCVLAYDDSSPQNQKTKDIIVPNNGVVVIVQGNVDTSTISLNQRFIFNGRPFKIAGYNNYMQDSIGDDTPNLLYFDTYLDEISPYDDLVNGIADNSQPSTDIGTNSGTQNIPTGQSTIVVTPYIQSITQGQNVELHAYVQDSSGTALTDTVICNPSGATMGNYTITASADNRFVLTNIHHDMNPLILTFTSGSLTTQISITLKGLF
jgi:hypothetical protein